MTYENHAVDATFGEGRIATLTLNMAGAGTLAIGGLGGGSYVDEQFNELAILPADIVAVAPEPGAAALFAVALGGLAIARRRTSVALDASPS